MKRFWHWLHSKRLSPVTWEETNVSVLWFLKSQVHTNVRGHLCASERVAATRRCAWNASRRKPSCRQMAARRCAIGREPGAEMFSWMSFRSRVHGRCVSSSPPPQVCRGNTDIYCKMWTNLHHIWGKETWFVSCLLIFHKLEPNSTE